MYTLYLGSVLIPGSEEIVRISASGTFAYVERDESVHIRLLGCYPRPSFYKRIRRRRKRKGHHDWFRSVREGDAVAQFSQHFNCNGMKVHILQEYVIQFFQYVVAIRRRIFDYANQLRFV